jgi:hypothetical protein
MFRIYTPNLEGHNSHQISEFDNAEKAIEFATLQMQELNLNYNIVLHGNDYGYNVAYLVNKATGEELQYGSLDKGFNIWEENLSETISKVTFMPEVTSNIIGVVDCQGIYHPAHV